MKKTTISLLITGMFAGVPLMANDFSQHQAALGAQARPSMVLFDQGDDENVPVWRIPSLLNTQNGTLILAVDKRRQHRGDWGDIETALRISKDNGKTWQTTRTILDLATHNQGISPIMPNGTNPWGDRNNPDSPYHNSAFLIDALMVQDKINNKIFLAVDMFPESAGFFSTNNAAGDGTGYVNINGTYYQKLNRPDGKVWTLRENGAVYDENNRATDYRVIVEGSAEQAFHNLGDIYRGDEKRGNIYLHLRDTNKNALFTVNQTAYLWLTSSGDEGKTWTSPRNISHQVKKDWMRFFGTGPGVGLQTKGGNLLLPIYYTNQQGAQSSALIISRDGGETWELGQSPNDTRQELAAQGLNSRTMAADLWINGRKTNMELTESQLVELDNGDIKFFMRNKSGKVIIATSKDGGYTWLPTLEKVEALNHPYSQISVIKYSKKINGKEYLIFSGPSESAAGGDQYRRNGRIYLGEVQSDGSISWSENMMKAIESSGFADGRPNGYVYSSLAELSDGTIGLAYENTTQYTTIVYQPINMQELFYKAGKIFADQRESRPLSVTYNGNVTLEKIGDGTAIKQGTGMSEGGLLLSEGTMLLAQQDGDDGNLAFTDVTLNNSGVLAYNNVQNIHRLGATAQSSGYLDINITENQTPVLNVLQGLNGAKDIALNVNLAKTLPLNRSGKYGATGANVLNVYGSLNGRTVYLKDGDITQGLYFYTLTQADDDSRRAVHRFYLTNRLIKADGTDLAANEQVNPSEVRAKVQPVFASYLSAGTGVAAISQKIHRAFTHELNHEKRDLFVHYLNGSYQYESNLGFADFGYDSKINYQGVMLGGRVAGTQYGNLYAALNRTDYKLTPKSADGDSKTKYRAYGLDLGFGKQLDQWQWTLLSGYQRHKGEVENGAQIKAKTAYVAFELGYQIRFNEQFALMPKAELGYQHITIDDVNAEQARIHYDKFNNVYADIGARLRYQAEKLGFYTGLGYTFNQHKERAVKVGGESFKQGGLGNAFNAEAGVGVNLTNALSLEAKFNHQRSQYGSHDNLIKAGLRYQF
ncbi:exo-alpha-sialidase [Pasteurellaceae bacterium LIM206]|nr:exo-alpha-sialidase [Pasteurellaceae bacterium LIM206]